MKKLLFINACTRGEASRTLSLCRYALRFMEDRYTVREITLAKEPLTPLSMEDMETRERLARAGAWDAPDLRYAVALRDADYVVIAAPYWDLSFPAALKLLIERANVCGVVFRYSLDGRPEGLCRAKGLLYVTTAGGFIGERDLGFAYVESVLAMMGIPNAHREACEGLDIIGADVSEALSQSRQRLERFCKMI